ncbi:hypothetical protein [Absidia glauca]|uniref:F-box domain-containing protein n=1 Tax=Absidia glauca TaxID=4829 RepID=A0A163JWA0_ABSGL|nr:hypothetical protein [Absidia glauca]
MVHLHYDILITLIPFLDLPTLIEYTTLCQALSQPALRQLWQQPRLTNPDQLDCFIDILEASVGSPTGPYHQYITGLTIAFSHLHPLPSVLETLLCHHLPNLLYLSLYHTYAVYSPLIRHYRAHCCVFKDLSLPSGLTQLSVTDAAWTDDHLAHVASRCPALTHANLMGFFSDKGLLALSDHCHKLQVLSLALPRGLVQSNTITQIAIDRLAQSCPLLAKFTCRGQIRLHPHHVETTFLLHCPAFTYCDVGLDT